MLVDSASIEQRALLIRSDEVIEPPWLEWQNFNSCSIQLIEVVVIINAWCGITASMFL